MRMEIIERTSDEIILVSILGLDGSSECDGIGRRGCENVGHGGTDCTIKITVILASS